MSVTVRLVSELERDRQAVFDYVTAPENMPKYFRPSGPIPGVERAHILGNGPVQKGAVRRTVMTDGTPLDEEITDHEPPRVHRYRIKGLRGPLRYLVRWIDSELIFSPIGGGTRVTWTYTYETTSLAARPVVALLARRFAKRAMQDAVDRVKSAV